MNWQANTIEVFTIFYVCKKMKIKEIKLLTVSCMRDQTIHSHVSRFTPCKAASVQVFLIIIEISSGKVKDKALVDSEW